jgi:ABC-type cobalamin transport system ATPase subunit
MAVFPLANTAALALSLSACFSRRPTPALSLQVFSLVTALGDAVNVAARLQDMTKTLNCTVVVSEDVCKNAGVAPDRVSIRGRDQPMAVCTAADPTLLASLLDEPASSLGTERQISAHDLGSGLID